MQGERSETKRAREETKTEEGFEQYIRENLMHRNKETLPSWDDIGGLEETKNTKKESIVLAYARTPEKVEIEGWRNILLFAAFFNVKAGQVLSKYYGESPKILMMP